MSFFLVNIHSPSCGTAKCIINVWQLLRINLVWPKPVECLYSYVWRTLVYEQNETSDIQDDIDLTDRVTGTLPEKQQFVRKLCNRAKVRNPPLFI